MAPAALLHSPVHHGCHSFLELRLIHGSAGTHGISQLQGKWHIPIQGISITPLDELARSVLRIPCFGGANPSLGRGMKHHSSSMGLAPVGLLQFGVP